MRNLSKEPFQCGTERQGIVSDMGGWFNQERVYMRGRTKYFESKAVMGVEMEVTTTNMMATRNMNVITTCSNSEVRRMGRK